MSSLESFEIGSLDLSGISADDLKTKQKLRYIYQAGAYNLNIDQFTLHTTEKMKDSAGKQWGGIQLLGLDTVTGRAVRGFISVPLETLVYTSKSGNTSNVRTKIFCDFIESITGSRPAPEDLRDIVVKLPELLKGATLTARVGYEGDYVNYVSKLDDGTLQFNIILKDGSTMVDADGNHAMFSSREDAVAYYQGVKGFRPSTNLSMLGFRKTRVAEQTQSNDDAQSA